jgi:hypothetical protein
MQAKTLTSVAVFDAMRGNKIGLIPKGVVFDFIEKNTTWLKRVDGTWVNCGSSFQYVQIINYGTTPPPVTPPAQEAVHIIRFNSVGQISVDGLPYE